MLPDIPGGGGVGDVGKLRNRYPIMPTHQEGSAVYKEVSALRDVVLSPLSRKDMYYEEFPTGRPTWTDPNAPSDDHVIVLKMRAALEQYDSHIHYIYITPSQRLALVAADSTLTVSTSENYGHSHSVVIKPREWGTFQIIKCDGQRKCWDYHQNIVDHASLTD